jgi:hypothetical protein
MRLARGGVAAALALMLVACGGGGGGAAPAAPAEDASTGTTTGEPALSADAEAVIASVAFYDMANGTERMFRLADAFDQLGALPGPAVQKACASGSITTQKTTSNLLTLVADNCKLSATDNLLYSGTWKFNVTHTEYNPDGTCTPGAACYLQANVDTSAGLFGYGSATEKVVDMLWQQQKTPAGANTTSNFLLHAVVIPEVGEIIFNGQPTDFAVAFRSPPALIARIRADSRTTLHVEELIRATLTVGDAGVTASIDTNKDGTEDKTILVPWSDFAK